jgi:hypothetical protein
MANEKKQQATPEITESNMDKVLNDAANGGSLDDAGFKALLQLMMLKEKRLIVKEAELERIQVERDKQAKVNSEQYTVAKIETQKSCRHLKGGKGRQRGQQKDPAVYAHTFTDGSTVIKCQLCGAKWMPKDTVEYIHRSGSAIPNWTGIGWREALELAGESSNRPSSSERFFATTPTDTGALRNEAGKIEVPKNFQI